MKRTASDFRANFKQVRRELSKLCCYGFGFPNSRGKLKDLVCEAMHYLETREHIAMIDAWVERAGKLGVAT